MGWTVNKRERSIGYLSPKIFNHIALSFGVTAWAWYDEKEDIFICGNCKDQIDKLAYIFNLHVEIENYKQAVSLLEDMVRDLRGCHVSRNKAL